MINELCLKAIVECKRLKSKALSENRGGTAYPGEAALKIYPNVLKDVAGDMPVIFITGTNGKTTTARMLGNVFEANNIQFITNREGANKPGGIAACFILRTGENGMLSGSEKIAIIEADEISIPAVIGKLNVFCVLITNLYDDQPYRLPEHREVAGIIAKSLAKYPEITCIFNENENGCKIIADKIPNEKIYFNDNVNVRLHYLPDVIYRADAAAALSLLKFLNERRGFNIDLDDAARIISETKPVFARNSSIKFGNINLKTELIKNSSNLDKVVDWLEWDGKKPDLIIASDDARELIWMKNYDWKRLEKLVGKIYLWGKQDEIKFLSEQLDVSKLNDFYEIENFLLNTENETVLLFDYYACLQIWEFFAEHGYIEHWWEN